MFYILYNKVCIEEGSAQMDAMKHCTEHNKANLHRHRGSWKHRLFLTIS